MDEVCEKFKKILGKVTSGINSLLTYKVVMKNRKQGIYLEGSCYQGTELTIC